MYMSEAVKLGREEHDIECNGLYFRYIGSPPQRSPSLQEAWFLRRPRSVMMGHSKVLNWNSGAQPMSAPILLARVAFEGGWSLP